MIIKSAKYKDMEACPQLNSLVQGAFSLVPSLSFHACEAREFIVENQKTISSVEVFDGEQRLGKMGWIRRYTRSGYENCYAVESPRINKQRGDKHVKTTTNPKTAIKLAVDHFIRDTDSARAARIFGLVKSKYHDIVWQYNDRYNQKLKPLAEDALSYFINTVEGTPSDIDPAMVKIIQSPEFVETRTNYRIAKSVQKHVAKEVGDIVYVNQEGRLTRIGVQYKTLTRLESSYDLPKNYQEKYAILKVMDAKIPIESIGFKVTIDLDGFDTDVCYLVPGEVIVTH